MTFCTTETGMCVRAPFGRLTDEGATHSQGLELICFLALLAHVRIAIYLTIVMDGCRDLIEPTKNCGKRPMADLWHLQKNWFQWSEQAIAVLCRRPQKAAAEKVDNPLVAAVKFDKSRLTQWGRKPAGVDALDFARQRVVAVGGQPPADADAATLKRLFGELTRTAAATSTERAQMARRQTYLAEKARREEAATARVRESKNDAEAQKDALAWRRDLRSNLRYVAEYTSSLRNTRNSASEAAWTDDERTIEFRRVWRESGVALILGRRTAASLQLISHPAAQIPGEPGVHRKELWQPKNGFVTADSKAFTVLDSLINDPIWDDKFAGLIDARMTFNDESFFHVLRKWAPKHDHFHRFYAVAIWCAVLSWNENATRPVLEWVTVSTKAGQLKSQAGRAYRVAVRPPPTNEWRCDFWVRYYAAVHDKPPRHTSQPMQTYALGWSGADPPFRTRVVAAISPTVAPPASDVDELSVAALKAELATHGLPPARKKLDLVQQLRTARMDPQAARAAHSIAAALRPLPTSPTRELARASPQRRRQTTTAERATVAALYGIPSPYRLPIAQRQKRRPTPEGTRKYTTKALTQAKVKLTAGERPSPLKRRKGATDAEAEATGEVNGEAMEEADPESEEGQCYGNDDDDEDCDPWEGYGDDDENDVAEAWAEAALQADAEHLG